MYLESVIQTNYPSMTKKEKKIADYLLNHSEEAKNQSISTIAEICGVAESTVFLFSKKIGLTGFKELTVLLSSDSKKKVFEGIYEEDSIQAITEKVIETSTQSLETTRSLIDFQQLEQAVDVLINSKKVALFALGGSSPIALDGYHKFLRSPLEVEFTVDYHMQLLNAGRLGKEHCAVIVSHSGRNSDMLRIADILNKNKVPIILITGFNNTSLVKKADYTFIATTEELTYKDIGIYTRRLPQMLIMDLLFTLVMISDKTDSIPSLDKIQDAMHFTK
ncbi:MurR/RpiR family transcriptional regulator [Enterococcus sp. AZ109]|uniref:MurR/RpiR family transcriptional regulator n=1 Tax=Enterococcus sp. AZ109 TaxID=2774634 RepID=UPI003F242FF3